MRFPSLDVVATELRRVTTRFPGAMVCCVVAAAGGVFVPDYAEHDSLPVRLLIAGVVGIAPFVALDLRRERSTASWGRWIWPYFGIATFLVVFFIQWPAWGTPIAWRRWFQYLLTGHLLAAVLPYISLPTGKELNGFWQYNRTLLLRFLTATLFALVLYVGLVIAFLAVDKLLGLDIDSVLYLRLFFIIFLLFHTPYFLGGVPRDLAALENLSEYPRGLKVFSQYILLPIVSVYLMILMLYLGKILFTMEWPSGWIGYLVSSVSFVGLLSLLLLYPIQHRRENRWVSGYARGFYFALLPALAMLMAALGKRIAQYGLTENRYFLAVLAMWMMSIAIYFLLRRAQDIRIIPASLCLLAALSSFGPWGAYTMSQTSQSDRLEQHLTANGLLVDGQIVVASTDGESDPNPSVTLEDRREIGAGFRYLLWTHGEDSVRPWFGDAWAQVDTSQTVENPRATHWSRYQSEQLAAAAMHVIGLDYVDQWQSLHSEHFNFSAQNIAHGIDISDYAFAIRVPNLYAKTVARDGQFYGLSFDRDTALLEINRGLTADVPDTVLASIPLDLLVAKARLLQPVANAPATEPLVHVEAEGKLMLVIYYLGGTLREEDSFLNTLIADVYLSP